VEEEQERYRNEKTEIFFLNPEIKKGLHLYAAERYYKWLAEVFQEIAQLTTEERVNADADINTYLNDDDKAQVEKYKQNILEWLYKCTNIGGGYSPYPYDRWVTSDMFGLKSLIKKAYKARAEKLEAERKQREWEEKWDVAYEAVSPPDADAHKYLTPEEYQKYEDSIPGAVRVYMEKGKLEIGLNDSFDYRHSLWLINYRKEREQQEINDRKEKERQQNAAVLAAREFNNSLSKHIAGLKSKLSNRPRDLRNYFTTGIRDKRYTGHNFDYVLDDEQKRNSDRTLVSIANDKLRQIIPRDLLEFIKIPDTYWRLYFPLPSISYSFEGIPCLDFNFDIFVAAHAEVLLKPKVKKFGICSFNLPAEKEGNVLIPLEEPKLLGYFHILLTPEELGGFVPWRTIPLVLLNWLFKGGTKPSGITISEASDDSITYKVQKFKEEVDIRDKFADYLKNIGSFDEMINMGIVIEKVASVAKNELGDLKVEHEASPLKDRVERKDTKKAKAFRLFDGGKTPSDREVKALKIKPKTSYNYYQEWKKLLA